jgi:hypothetical protein
MRYGVMLPRPALGLILCALSSLTPLQAAVQIASHPAVSLRPFMDEVQRLETAMSVMGQTLAQKDVDEIKRASAGRDPDAAVASVAAILDKCTLAVVIINPESWVDVKCGQAPALLIQNGTELFSGFGRFSTIVNDSTEREMFRDSAPLRLAVGRQSRK